MFKKHFMVAGALCAAIVVASPAMSATTVLPQDNSAPGPTLVFTSSLATATFGATYGTSGSFTDYFFFTLGSNANITFGEVTTSALGGNNLSQDLDFSVVNLGTGATTLLSFSQNGSDKNEQFRLSPSLLPYALVAGTYRLAVNGIVQAPTATYAGRLEFASAAVSAVPEPAAWAMMLFGFGGIGYAMRRRRKVAGRHAQAV